MKALLEAGSFMEVRKRNDPDKGGLTLCFEIETRCAFIYIVVFLTMGGK